MRCRGNLRAGERRYRATLSQGNDFTPPRSVGGLEELAPPTAAAPYAYCFAAARPKAHSLVSGQAAKLDRIGVDWLQVALPPALARSLHSCSETIASGGGGIIMICFGPLARSCQMTGAGGRNKRVGAAGSTATGPGHAMVATEELRSVVRRASHG